MKHISFDFSSEIIAEKGVICGVDCFQFWLLAFFLNRYHSFNNFPITIFDFGLNSWQKSWIASRYSLKTIDCIDGFIKDESEIDLEKQKLWESNHGSEFWSYREKWFKKPFACIKSPYEKSLWLDVDCEVLGPINDLFDCLEGDCDLAMVEDPKKSNQGYRIFNSGVIAFKKTAQVISLWAQHSLDLNDRFKGDQDVLSFLIHERRFALQIIPEIYNCSYLSENVKNCIILHWMGSTAKNLLREKIALSQCVKIS